MTCRVRRYGPPQIHYCVRERTLHWKRLLRQCNDLTPAFAEASILIVRAWRDLACNLLQKLRSNRISPMIAAPPNVRYWA